MSNFLVAIEADLPSSIALRYACRLALLTQARVQVIHVKEPEEDGPATGAGWASQTWRRELLKKASEEITPVLRDDLDHCPGLGEPIVVVGDRETEILAELGRRSYGLLVEGLPAPPTPALLHRKLRSEGLRQSPCPVLLGLTMAPLERALVILEGDAGEPARLERLAGLLGGAPMGLELATCRFPGQAGEWGQAILDQARQTLEGLGIRVAGQQVLKGWPEDLAPITWDYGLVVARMDREAHRDNPWLTMLGHCATSMLLCP